MAWEASYQFICMWLSKSKCYSASMLKYLFCVFTLDLVCFFFFLKTFYLYKNSTIFSRIAPLGNRLFQNLHGWGLSCRTLLHMILHSVGGSPARLPGGGGVLRSKICGVSTWQASVCVTFAHVSLTKTISMAKPRSKRARWPVVSRYSHVKRNEFHLYHVVLWHIPV